MTTKPTNKNNSTKPTNKNEPIVVNYRYRLYLTDEQIVGMNKTLGICCSMYNECSDLAKTIYFESKVIVSKFDLIKYFTDEKIGESLYTKVRQDIPCRYEKSRSRFFNKLSSPPKFKKRRDYNSFTYVQSGFKIIVNNSQPKKSLLRLSKLIEGEKQSLVELNLHRPLPTHSKIKSVTVIRKSTGKWFANFALEVPAEEFFEQSKTAGNNKAIGIDLGLKNFATFSNGETIETPHFLKKQLKRLRRRQKKLSRKVGARKGEKKSANYEKQRKQVALVYEKVSNQRTDFCFKTSHKLVNTNDNIACENLNPKFMIANRKLSRAASDASFSMFKQVLEYEAFKHQTKVVFVAPNYTTQDCFICRNRIQKDLSERTHECCYCGVKVDRDVNAAINVLYKAAPEFAKDTVYLVTDKLRWEPTEVTLLENVNTRSLKLTDDSSCVVEGRSHPL